MPNPSDNDHIKKEVWDRIMNGKLGYVKSFGIFIPVDLVVMKRLSLISGEEVSDNIIQCIIFMQKEYKNIIDDKIATQKFMDSCSEGFEL